MTHALGVLITSARGSLRWRHVSIARLIPRGFGCPIPFPQVVRWLMREKVCNGDRASAVRLGQDMVSHRLLTPVCAGYHCPEEEQEVAGGGGDSSSGKEQGELLRSFDDAVGWLFAFVGDSLRDPFAPPPPTQVAVMSNTAVDVRVTGWTEVSVKNAAWLPGLVVSKMLGSANGGALSCSWYLSNICCPQHGPFRCGAVGRHVAHDGTGALQEP